MPTWTTGAARGSTAAALLALAACTGGGRSAPPPAPAPAVAPGAEPVIRNDLPPVPARTGPLRVSVAYPGDDAAIAADSNFIFGSVGRGDASLTINGAPVEVAPNGGWLAFLPVPADGVYRLRAAAAGETAERELRVRAAPPGRPRAAPPGIVAASITPRGTMTAYAGEVVTVRFRGPPGGRARVVMPDGSAWPLAETRVVERAEGFQQDQAVAARQAVEYAGSFPVTTALRAPGDAAPSTLARVEGAAPAHVELALGTRTVREPLPLTLGVLRPGEVRAAVAAAERVSGEAIGTAVPGGNTPYNWMFPNGTRFTVTGEREGAYRVRLTEALTVWVDADDVRLEEPGAPPVAGTVGTVRVDPEPGWADVVLSTSERMPFEVRTDGEREITIHVFGGRSRTNWMHYGPEDPLVRRVSWRQEREDEFVVRVELGDQVWGWRSFWDANGRLVVRVRRPPPTEGASLRGLRIAVDAGHPPGGAIGPTGLTEAEANLAISKHLVGMLREAGAEVLETRPDTAAVALGARPVMAAEWDAHLLVSVHNNAFPDGVNPWENNGTSVFYNQPQSLGLARHMQRELLREFGLRDLGIARADLALVRPTWMPSVLTETMFLMIPQQEAALRDPAVHERIARAHLRAIERFLWDRAVARGVILASASRQGAGTRERPREGGLRPR